MEEKLESMKNIIIGIIVIFTLHMMASQTVSAQQPDFSLTNQEAQPIYAILFDILSNNRYKFLSINVVRNGLPCFHWTRPLF